MWFWVRLIIGVLVLLTGAIWIGQGLNLIKGSFMTGNATYTVIGSLVALGGLWLIWGPLRTTLQKRRP